MDLTTLIATGKSSKVYLNGDKAIKVFYPERSKVDVLLEALNTARVETTNLPIATIDEVTKINQQWAIVMNYIEGPTLSELMLNNSQQIEKYINNMVEHQLKIHTKQSPLLPKLQDKLREQILSLSCIDEVIKYELLTRLASMPKHNKLCHGDYEPRNIICNKETYYTLDWIHATQGNASADAARTYLLFSLTNKDIADLYLNTFCKKSNTKKQYVQQWLPIVAAAQLTKERPEEKEILTKWIGVVEYE